MNKTIWKFDLAIIDYQKIDMPEGAEVLSVQVQREKPRIWALVASKSVPTTRTFITLGTGHPVSENPGRFIGTYQLGDGDLVFHVFETTV